ncbi:Rne/Rng family ribonuclease [Nocardioides sp.]|uniref:Rne/Rng family ribonuclease n=1 Tax=Nocardioides sp. TaxID=35761 RepID=UPI003515C420
MTDASNENPTAPESAESPEGDGAAPAKKTAKRAPAKKAPAKKAAAKKTAAKKTAEKPPAKRAAKKAAAPKAADPAPAEAPADAPVEVAAEAGDAIAEAAAPAPAKKTAAKKTAAKKTAAKKTAAKKAPAKRAAKKTAAPADEQLALDDEATAAPAAPDEAATDEANAAGAPAVLFQPPAPLTPATVAVPEEAAADAAADDDAPAAEDAEGTEVAEDAEDAAAEGAEVATDAAEAEADETDADESDGDESDGDETDGDESDETEGSGPGSGARRRRRRGGRRRRKPAGEHAGEQSEASADAGGATDSDATAGSQDAAAVADSNGAATAKSGSADGADGADGADEQGESGDAEAGEGQGGGSSSRRRRRRRRAGEGGGDEGDDENTVTRVRKPRNPEDEITAVAGSTRLEAKKQRRREGREAGRRRAPIVSEAEFLARRESVDRVMAVRQRKDLTQIAVLEDKVLVEHYVARESQTSMIGNVYLGRVQNVLPSMEAAFIDIGKGRNAVLYAGEVNWSALGHKDGQPRKIESVLQSGQTVLVQVTKDPIGHKGARLTSQVSLAGRFLVYVPDGTTSGISRKLPDTERARLKALLKEIVPETAGVIVRTAAEGASEEELTRDVERLTSRWEAIEAKVAKGNAPQLLYGEPDLTLKVVRDLFTEDFSKLVVQGDDVWATVKDYVEGVAPDLLDRVEHHVPDAQTPDLFTVHRIDEQIAKGLDRKVWLPSGGSLIIDRTEAMTVVDVNTGKFTGSGGNLEETVTKNNLEAAEEIVRQLRLRDIGGIIVVDFIDMVLESNRDLVLRRLVECLGRDRTRHQVAEVTSLGLVQMTRKRIGTGLVEAFSENCSHCQGRGIVVHELPVEPKRSPQGGGQQGGDGDGERRGRRRRGRGGQDGEGAVEAPKPVPSPKDVAAMAKPAPEDAPDVAEAAPAPDVEAPAPAATGETAQDLLDGAVEAAQEAAQGGADVVTEATLEPVEPEPIPEPTPPAAPAPAAEIAPEPEADPVPASGTRVTTRTRRAAATRPAGQPAEGTVAIVVAEPTAAEAPSAPETPSAPPPKVTTRTRTRSARTTPGAQSAPTASSSDSPGSAPESGPADGEAGEPSIEHVPVKKKGGARKR